jgi:hypothetical protein
MFNRIGLPSYLLCTAIIVFVLNRLCRAFIRTRTNEQEYERIEHTFDALMHMAEQTDIATWHCNKNKSRDEDKQISHQKGYFIPTWKFEVPKTGEPHTKQGKDSDKTYYWCSNHHDRGMWTLHKPANCHWGNDIWFNKKPQEPVDCSSKDKTKINKAEA